MNQDTFDKAVQEARRFIKTAEDLHIHALGIDDAAVATYWRHLSIGLGDKHTAAVRRSSMDLTRALAAMRNPNA